jgi:hypothetical protein
MERSMNADALYTMCQDKKEKYIHVDSITVAESDERDYKERYSKYIHGRINVLFLSKT